jgi:hypothetical protein
MPLCFPFLNMPTLRQDTSNFARTRRFPKERKRAGPFLRFPSILLAISVFTGMRLVMPLCGRMRIRLANFGVLRSRIGPSFVSERIGQEPRWNFQHQLSCTYCAIPFLDQPLIQVPCIWYLFKPYSVHELSENCSCSIRKPICKPDEIRLNDPAGQCSSRKEVRISQP